MKIIKPLLVLSLAAVLPVHAQWYAGASIGQSHASADGLSLSDQLLDLGFDVTSSDNDESDTAYRVFGGWRLNRWAAVELGYADLGKRNVRATVSPAGEFGAGIRTRLGDVSVLGFLPAWNRLALYGRAGAYTSRTRASFSGSGSVMLLDGAGSQSVRRSGGLYGVGATFDITPQWVVRAEWTRYARLGNDITGGRFDADVGSVGLVYRF